MKLPQVVLWCNQQVRAAARNNPLNEITVGNEVVPVETPKILIPAEDGTLEPGKYITTF